MTLCLTKKVQDMFQVKGLKSVETPTIDTWHVTIDTINRKKMLVFCHVETGYTLFLYGLKKSDVKNLNSIFIDVLQESLRFDGFTTTAIDEFVLRLGDFSFGKTSNKSIIAKTTLRKQSMYAYLEYLDKHKRNQKIIFHRVNHLLDRKQNDPHTLMKDLLKQWIPSPVSYTGHEVDVAIELEEGKILRRLLVPSHYTLNDLHVVIQKAFGWKNIHLHDFFNDNSSEAYAIPEDLAELNDDYLDSRLLTLDEAFMNWMEWDYNYDFGDDWTHHIFCRMTHHSPHKIIPKCISFEGDNIPEDVGGILGYENFLTICNNPDHPEHESMKQWIQLIDHHSFDLELLNNSLKYNIPIELHYHLLFNPSILDLLKRKS